MIAIASAAPNRLVERVGPFYDQHEVAPLLGMTPKSVDLMRDNDRIIACPTAEGIWLYPTRQFDEASRSVKDEVLASLVAFRGVTRWAVALWFEAKNPDLQRLCPYDWAAAGRPLEDLVVSARHTAHAWR